MLYKFLPILLLLGFVPAATAQTDGCLQTNPCIFDVEVDESGISSVSISNLTSGDWFILSVSSIDTRSHTVSFGGVQVAVGAYGYADSQPFQAGAPGRYTLRDEPTGDEATLHVLAGDSVDAEDGAATPAGKGGIPSTSFGLLAIVLAAGAFLLRRVR